MHTYTLFKVQRRHPCAAGPGVGLYNQPFQDPERRRGKKAQKRNPHTRALFTHVPRGPDHARRHTHTHAEGEILRSFESEGFGSEAGTRAPTGRDRLFLLMSYFLFPTLHPEHRAFPLLAMMLCVCVFVCRFCAGFLFFSPFDTAVLHLGVPRRSRARTTTFRPVRTKFRQTEHNRPAGGSNTASRAYDQLARNSVCVCVVE